MLDARHNVLHTFPPWKRPPRTRPTSSPKAIYYQIAHSLRALLPPPTAQAPEDEACRDRAAIAHVASLLPADPEEANLAVQYVAACEQALQCLRLARAVPDDTTCILKCTAQAASMMRQARGWRTALQRTQADRHRRQDNGAARDTASAAVPPPAARPAPRTPEPRSEAQSHSLTDAEAYALAHPSDAALIRSLGRLPRKFNGAPLTSEQAQDIVNSPSPILQTLAKRPQHRLASTAS